VDTLCIEKYPLGNGGLARIDMCTDADVPDFLILHFSFFSCG